MLAWFKKRMKGRQVLQVISYVIIFSVLIIFIAGYPQQMIDWRFFVTVLALALLLAANFIWQEYPNRKISPQRKPRDYWVFCIATNLLVLAIIAMVPARSEVYFLLFLQWAQYATFFGVWPAGFLAALVNIFLVFGFMLFLGLSLNDLVQVAPEFFMGMALSLVFVFMIDRSSRETQRVEGLLKELEAANNELKTAQQKEKDLAVAEERIRLARDIHDGLGHHLTVLSIQLQAAEKLINRDAQAAGEAVRLCRAEAQAALDEVRQSVGMLRHESQSHENSPPFPELLAGVVANFERSTGLSSDFKQNGAPQELPFAIQQTLFRALQEGLTNVQKHGSGVTRVHIALEYTPGEVCLALNDNGQSSREAATSTPAGYGLAGLRERAVRLGGVFQSGFTANGGFEVEMRIPLKEAVHDQNPAGR
jgi:signal transduction histidine kinase